jgi:DnaJ-like protein
MRSRLALAILGGMACLLFSASSAMAQGGELVSAEWGVQGRRVDVTARVRSLARNGVLNFQVTRFVLGVDPDPHRVKDLLIRVRRWDGQVEEYDYAERGVVNLELDPEYGYQPSERGHWGDRDDERRGDHDRDGNHDRDYDRRGPRLRILRAYYGAEGQFINVTDALQGRIDDGRIYIRVDNNSMGGDPLPGRRKWLRVLYSYNGERRNLVIEEKTDLQLP